MPAVVRSFRSLDHIADYRSSAVPVRDSRLGSRVGWLSNQSKEILGVVPDGQTTDRSQIGLNGNKKGCLYPAYPLYPKSPYVLL